MSWNILKNKKYSPGFRQFIARTFIFIAVFIILSYFLGRKAYGADLLYGFDFYIYGGMGYIILFSILGFILLYREKLLNMSKHRNILADWILLLASFALVALFYFVEINISKISVNLINILLVHLLLIGAISFLIVGIYGSGFLSYFIKRFRKELIYFLIFGIVAYSLMSFAWNLWPYLSATETNVVYFLLKFVSNDVHYTAPNIIIFEGFGVQVGEPCSGIYSIFIFTGLYLFIMFVDWKKLNKAKALSVFLPAVFGAFVVNIFRVFLLMIIGARLSKEAALGLYHSYTGMIFFLIYFIAFWGIFYKWIRRK